MDDCKRLILKGGEGTDRGLFKVQLEQQTPRTEETMKTLSEKSVSGPRIEPSEI
jgi:hypothetical protein